MKLSDIDYLPKHDSDLLLNKQHIIYSFNNIESDIIGAVVETESRIYLYEYRGKYVGTEFFISFSKESSSYKLIQVDEIHDV